MNNNVIIKNIFYMLAYVFNHETKENFMGLSSDNFENIDEMLSSVLNALMEKEIKKGIYKTYIDEADFLKTLRGKINFAKTIKSNALLNKEVFCEYDEYSENNDANQIIKATLNAFLKSKDVSKEYKRKIKSTVAYLVNVETIDVKHMNIRRVQISNQNKSYKFMLFMCELYQSKELFSEDDSKKLQKFIETDSFHDLYENFVLEYYRKEHPHLKAKGTNMRWLTSSENSILPMMKTDITLFSDNHVLIIDTKYYKNMYTRNYGSKKIDTANLYQIFSYVYNYSTQNNIKTSGMLLYAETKHEDTLDAYENINGYDLYFKSLNLNQDFDGIKKRLDNIALHVNEEYNF